MENGKKQEIRKEDFNKSTDQRINNKIYQDQLGHGWDLWSCLVNLE